MKAKRLDTGNPSHYINIHKALTLQYQAQCQITLNNNEIQNMISIIFCFWHFKFVLEYHYSVNQSVSQCCCGKSFSLLGVDKDGHNL